MKISTKIKISDKLGYLVISLTVLSIFADEVQLVSSLYSNDAYHHKHILGPEGNYTLEWTVLWESKTIVFNVSAECKGYIGMGLSKTGSISGSDFVIGGIDSSGKPYFSDMHGISNGTLQEDFHFDWTLLNAHRENGRIHLSFSRPFETCDDEDYPISKDLVHIIWVYGDTDEITLFSPHQGTQVFYLLDPDLTTQTATNIYREIGPHSNLYLMQQWRAVARQKVPPIEDSRLCSIIKGPRLNIKHFILGGGAYLPNETAGYIRQIILNRCLSPEGNNATILFDPLTKREGFECSSFQNSSVLPKHLCTETVFVWGYGGKPYYFPEDIGIPMGMSADEYYMLEIQYHNPWRLESLKIKAGFELMIHPRPKKYEGGILTVNYGHYGMFTIPPRSPAFNIYGHCSSQCIKDTFPDKGMNAFSVLFQMGQLGRMIRLRHFHGTEELPWILSDDNYNHTYQQIRLLSNKVTILPGDQLTLQCTYDSSMVSNATFSGFSNNQEQCVAYVFVTQRVTSAWCSSEYSRDSQQQYFGTQNKNFSRNNATQKGLNSAFASTKVLGYRGAENGLVDKDAQWSPSARAALQRDMLHGSHKSSCPSHQQMAKYGRPQRFPVASFRSRRLRNEKASVPTSLPTLSTPFAGNSVTIPSISLEYRPSSECQRTSGPVNNFGYHRNIVGKFKPSPVVSTTETSPGKTEYKSNLQQIVPRFRRLNG